jgi:hypothetical protein
MPGGRVSHRSGMHFPRGAPPISSGWTSVLCRSPSYTFIVKATTYHPPKAGHPARLVESFNENHTSYRGGRAGTGCGRCQRSGCRRHCNRTGLWTEVGRDPTDQAPERLDAHHNPERQSYRQDHGSISSLTDLEPGTSTCIRWDAYHDTNAISPAVLDKGSGSRRLRCLEPSLHAHGSCPERNSWHELAGSWQHLRSRSGAVI